MPPGNSHCQRSVLARYHFVFVLSVSMFRACYCGYCYHALPLCPWSFLPTSGALWHPLQGNCNASLLPLIALHRQVYMSFCLQIHKVDTCPSTPHSGCSTLNSCSLKTPGGLPSSVCSSATLSVISARGSYRQPPSCLPSLEAIALNCPHSS